MRSAGFEPAIPSLGSSYLNQAGLTSLAITDDKFGIIRLLFASADPLEGFNISRVGFLKVYILSYMYKKNVLSSSSAVTTTRFGAIFSQSYSLPCRR